MKKIQEFISDLTRRTSSSSRKFIVLVLAVWMRMRNVVQKFIEKMGKGE